MKDYKVLKEYLLDVEVPENTRTWKPVSHATLIDITIKSINQAGFSIVRESYTAARDGKIANGLYTINLRDQEMQLQIGWQNSIDKSKSLKWAMGVRIFICGNGCVSGDIGAFKSKHVGKIQEFTPEYIADYIKSARLLFKRMQDERDSMKTIDLDSVEKAKILGEMYVDRNLITSSQLSIIKSELYSPTYEYDSPDTLWELYQYCTFAMKNMHPALRMDALIQVNKFFNEYAI